MQGWKVIGDQCQGSLCGETCECVSGDRDNRVGPVACCEVYTAFMARL